jgi:ankyrin repeat protein
MRLPLVILLVGATVIPLSAFEPLIDPIRPTIPQIDEALSECAKGSPQYKAKATEILQLIAQSTEETDPVLYLLGAGADPNRTNAFGVNAFDKYKRNQQAEPDVLDRLWAQMKEGGPITILKYGSAADIDRLLETGKIAGINTKLDVLHPLEWIALFNSETVLKTVLGKHQWDVSSTPDLILSTLRYMNYSGDKINLLADYGFSVNAYRITSLRSYHAPKYNIDRKGPSFKEYPILFALRHHLEEEIIARLVSRGSVLRAVDGEFDRTTLHYACAYIRDASLLHSFVRAYDNLNPRDLYDRTPIFYAMFTQPLDNLTLLVEAGCDLNVPCGRDGLPLNRVMYRHAADTDVILAVIRNTKDVNSFDTTAGQPLFIYLTAHRGGGGEPMTDVLDALITKGALVNEYHWGRTPLTNYCRQGRDIEVVRLLITRGADPTLRENNGKDAFDHMRENRALKPYIDDMHAVWEKKNAHHSGFPNGKPDNVREKRYHGTISQSGRTE